MDNRRSGILLHITSLPSEYGIGDMGPESYRFADFLCESGQSYWQLLPLNPTLNIYGNSPYSSYSCFAGNDLLISPEMLYHKGLLSNKDLKAASQDSKSKVNYESVWNTKNAILDTAFSNFNSGEFDKDEFKKFCEINSGWLDDFSLFVSLKEHFGGVSWNHFPAEIAGRNLNAVERYRNLLANKIDRIKFCQYIFFDQWLSLREYCHNINIDLIGDLPIYVNYDSADVWCNLDKFKLDEENNPLFVSGVPPDYFSKTGQLWGNPVYNWEHMKLSRYKWWVKRLEQNFRLFDIIRLDHFRGFVSYWEVPAKEKTAINGRWVDVPSEDFFSVILKLYKADNFIAEDLGTITEDVIEMRDKLNLQGMKILQFAFGDDYPNGSYLPHNHVRNCVVYTGTHDNNTIVGWWNNECSIMEKSRIADYYKHELNYDQINWEFIEIAMGSIANTVIFPMQDLLGLDEQARMNTPSVARGNWEWRLDEIYLTSELQEKLRKITVDNDRI